MTLVVIVEYIEAPGIDQNLANVEEENDRKDSSSLSFAHGVFFFSYLLILPKCLESIASFFHLLLQGLDPLLGVTDLEHGFNNAFAT